jgi:single-stranded-DNA-specific exonuclease
VVTDHHAPRDTLPDAVAVVNPHRADCPSRFKELAGVGVAFKLLCALEEDDGAELLEYYSDIIMLGTMADVVSLTGENRAIATHGLTRLADTHRPGLAALMQMSGITGDGVSSQAVAFGLIPRLNAAGRMGCVDDAVELLLTDDVSYATDLARKIDSQNELRKETESLISAEIQGILAANPEILSKRVLIVSGNNWHHGVMGIVAAKVAEKYQKPAILFSVVDGEARGSGRSVEGYSLVEAITACSGYLTRYGGHTLAAGLTLPADRLDDFTRDLEAYTGAHYPSMPVPPVTVDCALHPARLTIETVESLSFLEPFGAHNPSPLFLLEGLTIDGVYSVGGKKHTRIRFASQGVGFYAVYFRMSEERFPYRPGDKVDAIVNLNLNEYNGKTQISVKIKDLRLSGVPQEVFLACRGRYARHAAGSYLSGDRAALTPDREHLAVVYRYLRGIGSFHFGSAELYYRLLPSGIEYSRMMVALDVLEEMELISRTDADGCEVFSVTPSPEKTDMGSSKILAALALQ